MTDQVVPIEGKPLSQVERVVDTFIAPTKTFTDILRSKSWWLPFLLGVVASYVLTFGIQQKVGWSQLADNAVAASPSAQAKLADATPEQAALQHKIMTYSMEGGFYLSPVINIIALLVVAVVLWLSINFAFAGKSTFGQVFCLATYAYLPAVIKALIATVVLYAGSAAENFTPDNMLGTSLGYYIESPGALKTFLSGFDLFSFWTMILLALGLGIVAKTKRSTGFIVVFGWWALILLVRTGFAAL